MHRDIQLDNWTAICTVEQIVPNTGVAALVNGQQIAVFRLGGAEEKVLAIGNFDPNSGANVISRGLVGNLGERTVVASPIYKHHFDLNTGECLEDPVNSVPAFRTRVEGGKVWVAA